MIKAAIFDMDGLLINSEPFWQQAEITIFKKVNIHLTKEMCIQTMGLRIDEVVAHWHSLFPWSHISQEDLQKEIIDSVIHYIQTDGQAMDGVYQILELLTEQNLKIGLASSSFLKIIKAVIEKLKLEKFFTVVHSAEFEEYGKPHPAIYINTAKQLGVPPTQCVAFEDSFNGLIAARAARMKAVAVPEQEHYHLPKFEIAHIKLSTLKAFGPEHLDLLKDSIT